MNPTPVAPISSGVQQMPEQQQAVLPEEFEAQLAGYLDKEKSGTIHKESSDSEKTTEQEINQETEEDTTDEAISLDSPLLYTGTFNLTQKPVEVNQPLNSSEPIFAAQITVETEKIDAIAVGQNEKNLPNTQENQFVESLMEPLATEVSSSQQSLKDQTEPIESIGKTVTKPAVVNEPTNRIQGESIAKDALNLLVEETNLIEMDQMQSTTKENEMVGSILPTGRFLTAEWKNDRMAVNQLTAKPSDSTGTSLNKVLDDASQPSEALSDNELLQPQNLATVESKLNVLTEPVLNETLLKKSISRMTDSENTETAMRVAEMDTDGQTIHQQPPFEATAVKQSNVIEPVRQASVQMINEVVLEQAEAVLSGKQSIAHVILTPAKMGEVKITVELTDNVLLTKIVVDNLETRELLTTGMQHLTDKLDRQNIRLGELTIQLNENATAGFTSQERQQEGQQKSFESPQMNFSDNEIEMLKTEEKAKIDTGRLSILV
ncbi:flagellar hook-length control protein FliK [Carnobacterium jeotgali]|uniref:flagellar hook-length control protein FliK n=1 Tax=Carnobacterium jeotgali TaxID=545534 RepID=UPI00049321ED|nr:flagellar hook-length control protein FliK [Carnobacterium jeotgali]